MQRVDVASLELCRELYDLSDWEETGLAYVSRTTGEQHVIATDYETPGENWDFDWAYDLSYVLRKIPPYIHTEDGRAYLSITRPITGTWQFAYEILHEDAPSDFVYPVEDICIEDAVCRFAITLHRQNILQRDDGANDAK